MKVIDKFMAGDSKNIDWCFENTHFIQRLNDNGIKKEFIVNCVINDEPIDCQHLEANKYAVIFKAPKSKDYDEIRVIIACHDNSINLVSIMRNNETITNRQNNQYKSAKDKKINKMYINAMSKRKY